MTGGNNGRGIEHEVCRAVKSAKEIACSVDKSTLGVDSERQNLCIQIGIAARRGIKRNQSVVIWECL